VSLLKARYGANADHLETGMDMDALPRLITVQSMTDAVLDILDTLPATCPECEKTQWQVDGDTHILCGSCGEQAVFENGDDMMIQWLEMYRDK
jgi:hypothetical protein